MEAALNGYAVIWSVIAVGFVCGHFRVLNEQHRELLSNFAFSVASPFLLFSIMAKASLAHVFSTTLAVSAAAILVAGASYLLVSRLFRPDVGGRVVGTLCSAYTNAGNLGLPVAAYILGDMTWMAPIMLIQLGLLQPTAIAILDSTTRHANRRPWWYYATLPFRNPITVGTLAGLVVNLVGLKLPDLLWQPIDMVGNAAVPVMLIAFGVSLRLDPPPGRGPHRRELVAIGAIKALWHPLVAWLLATAVGLSPHDTLAVVVIAALPSAQNIYLLASRYRVRTLLARDAIFCTTIASVPVIMGVATVLGG